MASRQQQHGEGLTSLFFWAAIGIGGVLLGLRLFPIWQEKLNVDGALESVAQTISPDTTKSEIIAKLVRQFSVSDVSRFGEEELAQQLKVGSISGHPGRVMVLNYDIKALLFGNWSVVYAYKRTLPLPGGAE